MQTTIKKIPIKSIVSYVWQFLRIQPWSFFFLFLFSLAWTVDSLVWPYLLRLIIDTLTQFESNRLEVWGSLKWLLISGICLWIFVEILFRSRDFIRAFAFPKLESNIRMSMFDHIQHHSPKYFNEHFAGSLANKISDMTSQIVSILQNLMVFIPAVASSTFVLLFFSEIQPIFAWILGIWIILHISICLLFTSKCVAYSKVHGEARSTLVGKIVDSFTNNFAVNLFYRYKFEKERIWHFQKIEKETNFQSLFYVAKMLSFLSILFLFGMIALNSFLVVYWTQSKITTGEVIQVFNTTFNVVMILWIAGDLMPQFFQSLGVIAQALSVIQEPQDVIDPPNTPPLNVKNGSIKFENVSFKYGEKNLFEEKNITIKGGEKVGLVGYSGAGKSTFVNLILRFYPIEKGRILIDDQDIAHVTLDSLRKQIALIPQDPLLFHRTLEENIQFGKIDATKEEIVRAAKMAHCDEFIKNSPQGYESIVGERGTKLSGGERQRIAIARAILAAAPIIILDEATSALDSVTEKFIQESLETLMQNRTTIVIAHRLSTLAKMDRIIVFDKGRIVEEGTHVELLAKHGYYARMWHMQVGGFLPEQAL